MFPRPTVAAPYVMVSQMASGAYAEGASFLGGETCGSSSLTTYDTLEALTARPDVAVGALIVDKRPIQNNSKAVRSVISGPMLKIDLPACTVDSWGERTTFATPAEALASRPKGFDYISADIYAEFWRLLGARIGRKASDGSIAWEQDLCPLCGEDREHPSQHGAHTC